MHTVYITTWRQAKAATKLLCDSFFKITIYVYYTVHVKISSLCIHIDRHVTTAWSCQCVMPVWLAKLSSRTWKKKCSSFSFFPFLSLFLFFSRRKTRLVHVQSTSYIHYSRPIWQSYIARSGVCFVEFAPANKLSIDRNVEAVEGEEIQESKACWMDADDVRVLATFAVNFMHWQMQYFKVIKYLYYTSYFEMRTPN